MSFTRLLGLRRILAARPRLAPFTIARSVHIDLNDTVVQKYLRHLVIEYGELQSKRQLDEAEHARLQRITPVVRVLDERVALHDNIASLTELNKQPHEDRDMRQLIKKEATAYLARLQEIDGELQDALLEPDYTSGGVVVEVSAGVGGQEAMLFASELLLMYENHARHRGWSVEREQVDETDIGGLRRGVLLVSGLGAPELLSLEAGVHRVQRIPSTERGGRVHTSTVTVAVLPAAAQRETELELPERDLAVETKRASGAGGQHVNTTDSAVRITHLPTGVTVECQEGRSQIKNKKIALEKLRTLLLQQRRDDISTKMSAQRKSQVGSGERNEKIRTYNFPQDRVTEHRAGGVTVHDLRALLQGGPALTRLQTSVLRHQRHQRLLQDIADTLTNADTQHAQ